MSAIKRVVSMLCAVIYMMMSCVCSAGLMDHPTVAVIPFSNQAASMTHKAIDGDLEEMRTITETDLLSTGRFKMVDRVTVDKLIAEHEFDRSGLVDPNTAAKLGKMLGAQYLVLGTLTNLSRSGDKNSAHVTLRMIAVETASIALAGRGSAKTSDSISETLIAATEDALDGKRGILTMLKGGRK